MIFRKSKQWSKQWTFFASLIALSVAAGYGVRILAGKVVGVQAQGENAAFTATVVTKQYDSLGNETVSQSTIFARKASGSTVTIRDSFRNAQSSKSTTIQSIEEMTAISALNDSKVKMTTRLSTEHLDRLRANQGRACATDSASAAQAVLGIPVVTKSSMQDGSDGKKAVIELMLAPSLGCYPMKKDRRVVDANGKLVVREMQEVVNVTLGEPNPALFTIPDDFLEKKPSEAYATEAARLGDPECKTCSSRNLGIADDRYVRNR